MKRGISLNLNARKEHPRTEAKISSFFTESPSRSNHMGLLNSTRVSATVGGKEIILETGRVARQANGAI